MLRKWLVENGFSVSGFAEKSGVSRYTLYRYFDKAGEIRMSTAKRLSVATGGELGALELLLDGGRSGAS